MIAEEKVVHLNLQINKKYTTLIETVTSKAPSIDLRQNSV